VRGRPLIPSHGRTGHRPHGNHTRRTGQSACRHACRRHSCRPVRIRRSGVSGRASVFGAAATARDCLAVPFTGGSRLPLGPGWPCLLGLSPTPAVPGAGDHPQVRQGRHHPLAPRTAWAIDLAIGERCEGCDRPGWCDCGQCAGTGLAHSLPAVRSLTGRVHGYCDRIFADGPEDGQPVVVKVWVRRLRFPGAGRPGADLPPASPGCAGLLSPKQMTRAPRYRRTLADPYRTTCAPTGRRTPAVIVRRLLAEIHEQGYIGSMNLLYRYSPPDAACPAC
jgi:hypothetical protein